MKLTFPNRGREWIRRARSLGAKRLEQRLRTETSNELASNHNGSGIATEHVVRKRRVLVVAPHMDDEVIGPGGTLALHREAGSDIRVVFCGAGATPEEDRVRKAEARAVAQLMNFRHVRFLDYPDGNFSLHEDALARELARELAPQAEDDPEIIFCPFPADHHRDHTAASVATALAIETSGYSGEVWAYEVWSTLWPNTLVDISRVSEIKREAISLHASQTAGLHYVDGALGFNRFRAHGTPGTFAEAFYVCTAEKFCSLAAHMNRI